MRFSRSQIFYWATPILSLVIMLLVVVSAWWDLGAPSRATENGLKAFQQENYSEAIRYFSEAQQHCETNIMARYYLGAAYQNYKWQDEALDEYDVTWNLSSEYGTRSMHSAGRIWLHRKDLPKATLCYQRAISLSPTSPVLWFELAQVYDAASNLSEAEKCLTQAIKYDPKNQQYRQALLQTVLKRQQQSQMKWKKQQPAPNKQK